MTVFESPVFYQALLCFLAGYLFAAFCASLFGAARDIVNAGLPAS